MAVLAGIDALEQRDFPRAEQRFGEAVAADRRGAIASFPAAYASRDAVSVKGALNKVTQPCTDAERSGSYDEQARFEIEDSGGATHRRVRPGHDGHDRGAS